VDHVNRESHIVEGKPAFPTGTSHRHNVVQEGGDQMIPVSCPVGPAWFAGLASTRHGGIECRSSLLIENHGMNGYILAILCHIHP
jgi:hypothetical protein